VRLILTPSATATISEGESPGALLLDMNNVYTTINDIATWLTGSNAIYGPATNQSIDLSTWVNDVPLTFTPNATLQAELGTSIDKIGFFLQSSNGYQLLFDRAQVTLVLDVSDYPYHIEMKYSKKYDMFENQFEAEVLLLARWSNV
jgi:hypothetical protein